jgi:hypothetical protein
MCRLFLRWPSLFVLSIAAALNRLARVLTHVWFCSQQDVCWFGAVLVASKISQMLCQAAAEVWHCIPYLCAVKRGAACKLIA